MTNRELGERLQKLVLSERLMTHELLKLIQLGIERRSYLEMGYSSMFDWLTRGCGYSAAAAIRRIDSAKLFSAVPEVGTRLEMGVLNLSSLSKAQSIIRAQEKASGEKVSTEQKVLAVGAIENKSTVEAERKLLAMFPAAVSKIQRETRIVIDEKTTRHAFNFNSAAEANLSRARELLSHQLPDASDAEVFAYALKFLLDQKDPLRAPKSTGDSAAEVRRTVIQDANASCSFKDELTGVICGSRYQVQIDHIVPKALGGTDDPSNLRVLCRQHNMFMADQSFGKEHMNQYRSSS